MKPDPFEPPLQSKPAAPAKPAGFPFLRCCVITLVGGIAVCAGCCGIGNYIFFHTSVPLAYLEKAMEESGDVEIEGMTGTISNGFHIDNLRIRNEGGNWNELDEVDFRFNGVYELVMKHRLFIEQFTVGRGEFYYHPIDNAAAGEAFKTNDEEAAEEAGESPRPVRSRSDTSGIKEFRVDLFRLSNLKFINRETKVEFKIDEISIKDFQIVDDQLVSLGGITVESDHIEFHTEPNDRFDDQPEEFIKRKFTGQVRATASDRILKDVSYDMDICFARNGRVMVEAHVFDDKVTYSVNPKGETTVAFRAFSLQDYFTWDDGVLPSQILGAVTFHLENSVDDEIRYTIAPDSTFHLGDTAFTIETTEVVFKKKSKQMPLIAAIANSGEQPICCRLRVLRDKPYLAISLESGNEKNTPDLFSKTIFAKQYCELSKEHKRVIDGYIKVTTENQSIVPTEGKST